MEAAASSPISGTPIPLAILDLAVLSSKFNALTGILVLFATACAFALRKIKSASRMTSSGTREMPGPWFQLPIIGYLPFLGSKPFIKLWQMSRRYGPVFQIRMGVHQTVVLNGTETIKTAFLKNANAFAGRPDFKSSKVVCGGKSLVLQTYSSSWNFHHKAAVRVMSTFVSSKHYPIDTVLYNHGVTLANRLIQTGGDVDPLTHVEECIVNLIYQLCFGLDDDFAESPNLLKNKMMRITKEIREVALAARCNDMLPSCFSRLLQKPLKTFSNIFLEFDSLVTEKLDKILSADGGYKPGNPRCIADALQDVWNDNEDEIKESQKANSASDAENQLTRYQLIATVEDLIGAATETIISFFYWSILYLAKYPDIQTRLRAEVEFKIGSTRAPTSADRLSMPFVEAFMWEVVRHSCLLPLGLPHSTTRDVLLNGILIPKNTLVIANLYSTGADPAVWKDPDEFRPDRLLRPNDGEINRDLLEQFLCFSVGRRKCLGAELARQAMFVIVTVLVQKCKFEPLADGQPLNLDSTFTTSNAPKPYRVKATACFQN